jgi:hypothetical protein
VVRGSEVGGDVQVVPEDSQGEDGDSERIAAEARVTAEELRDDFIVVFCNVLVVLFSFLLTCV